MDLNSHPLINADTRREIFSKLVTDISEDPNNATFSLAIADRDMVNLTTDPKNRALLEERIAHWLSDYFPGMPVLFGPELGAVQMKLEGATTRVPTIRVTVKGLKARDTFDELYSGYGAALPDYQDVLETANSESAQVRYLMERVKRRERSPIEGVEKFDFSVPSDPKFRRYFCDTLREQYGKQVVFRWLTADPLQVPVVDGRPGETEELARPMVQIGVSLHGESAQRFVKDYEAFKGQAH